MDRSGSLSTRHEQAVTDATESSHDRRTAATLNALCKTSTETGSPLTSWCWAIREKGASGGDAARIFDKVHLTVAVMIVAAALA